MNQKLLSKVLATILAVILTFANFVMTGVYASKSYATGDSLENQEIVSNNENVTFDAYFASENGKKVHTLTQDIDENAKLYLAVKVEKGYLKNAKVAMWGQDKKEANFKMLSNDEVLKAVESINTEKNEIALKQVNAGTQIVLEVPIASLKTDTYDLSNFNKINNITLTGFYVDNTGKTISIEKTINTRNEWTKEVKEVIEQETKTYIPYEVKEEKGTIVQTVVRTGLENNSLPIKQTKITLKVPEVNGVKPAQVIVNANNTYATNNKPGEEFIKENWKYDVETGIIEITVNNEPNENKVAWNKTNKDEYVITYVFEEKLEAIDVKQVANVVVTPYNVTAELTQENTLDIKESAKKGNFVTTQISSNDSLSKGYLYTKSEKELEYNENLKLEITYANLIDKVTVENEVDNFINSKGVANPLTVANENYAYYKTTSISKENFEKILGQEGYLKIIGKDGERLAIFTKDTEADENGNYVHKYENQVGQIKIETSKPIIEGILEINNVKSLKGQTAYSKTQVTDFQKLQLKVVSNVEYADTKIEATENLNDITLIAPSTKIEAGVSTNNLSTIVKNENVELRVVLKTNDISCDLFKNPVVEIVLPSYIEELKIKDIDLLFDNELTIKSHRTYVNAEGKKVIEVQLKGEQISYIQNEISKGANLVINTDITLKKLTPTKEDVMKVYVTNENVTTYESTETKTETKAFTQLPLKAVAPTGMVTTSTITGYNSKGETVTSISGEAGVGKLDAKAEAKVATVTMDVINNYNNKINNIKILGRMPKAGNKDVVTNEDLGSNLDVQINSSIKLINANTECKYAIYYSTNEVATEDITNPSNGWQVHIDEMNTIKSYLIIFDEYEMNTGDKLSFQYNTNIPENVEYNKSVYTNYVVYFDNLKENETIKDKQKATKIGLTTGEGPNLEVAIRNDVQEKVEEGTIITYTLSARNTGKTSINNVTVSGNIPEGTVYTYYVGEEGTEGGIDQIYDRNKKEYSEIFEEIKPDEVKTIRYQVKVDELLGQSSKAIEVQGTAKVEKYEATFKSQPVTNEIVKGYLNVNMTIQSYGNKREGKDLTYITTITNVNTTQKENVVVTDKLPEGLTFISANNDGTYDKNTNTVTWNLGTIAGNGMKYIVLNVKIDQLPEGQTKREISNVMNIKTSEKELRTNEISFTVDRPVLYITQDTSTQEKVVIGDIIKYDITIKNLGEIAVNDIVVKDYMPQGLLYRGATYIVNGEKYESWIGNTDATINIGTIKPGETVDITIKAMVEDSEENKTERKVTNIVELRAEDITKIGSNPVSHTIVKKAESEDPSTGGDIEEGTYKITGLAWLDANQDGKRDEKESTIGNIDVMLVNSETGKIVVDSETGNKKVQTTDENGGYTFANLKTGKYLVIFFYDTANYGVTKYKVDGVIDSKNSDVISMKVSLNGKTRLAAVANSIQIENQDVTNIDMGLVVSPKFDLKLDKSVSKITVNNAKGTKTYEFEDSKFAKVDLKDKEINGTTVIVEYKVKVTNEGAVAGYAKKIVDYMPQDMKFSSELNKDWYAADSGNLYNSSLANTLLQPGETKELTLILTRKMTTNNTGTINNVAEIYEASNDLGMQDVDSLPANKVQSEDDISSADVVIGIKTGEVYVYILITLISITILGIGIYFINKKVLRRI